MSFVPKFSTVPHLIKQVSRVTGGCNLLAPFHLSASNLDVYEIVGERDFKQKVMESSVPVIVHFHAEWCEPCHSLKSLLQKVVHNHHGKIHLAEIIIDDHAVLLQTFEVTAVPAVIAFSHGQIKDKFIGLISEKQIESFVQNLLK